MKKVLVGTAVAVLAVPAFAQEVKLPTIYGQVNKAISYVNQKKEMNYSKMTNLMDVKNSESRLGAKGTHEVDTLKVNYNLLVGLDSSDPSAGSQAGTGRIRIRLAEVSFADAWGTVFAGQTGDIASAIGAKMDPLATTTAGVLSADMAYYMKNATSSIGYLERNRADQIGYKTPEFMGLQLALASYKVAVKGGTADETADDNSLVNATTPDTTVAAHPGTRYNSVLSYNHKFNDLFKMEAYAGYNILSSSYYKSYNDYLGAVSLNYGEFTLNGEYTKLNRQAVTANAFKKKNTMIQASLKWNHGDHTVAATFANRKNEEIAKGDAAATTADNALVGKYNQIAAGYMYNFNKYVQLRGTYAHYTVDTDATNKAVNFKNTADMFSLGTLVTF